MKRLAKDDTHAVLADKAIGRYRERFGSEQAKTKIGIGMKSKKKTKKKMMKKRIFLMTKRGDALPFLPILGALDRRSGQRGKSDKRQQSRATSGTVLRYNIITRPIRRTIRASADKCVCGFYK
ncbi:hypothetical protein G5I_12184 [Acromyrmex echinatior]|uniref:Uncharacterized protein n=1 Tax=Acromyrmex echinatior TaxID=103372 RepID=F4X1M2_ACREC|nr:hypothetical protein G5I_12184 [Acromyrmex echinatior]